MIEYLSNENIDRRKWDEAINSSFNGIVYAYSWYLDIVSPDWEALVKDDYKSVMPLPWRKKYGIHYLFPPFFTQQLGVFSTEKSDSELVHQFLEAIPIHFKFIEINLNTFNKISGNNSKTNSINFSLKTNLTHELDLIESYDSIEKKYSQNLKRNLKKAYSNNLQLVLNNQPEPVVKLFRENKGSGISKLKEDDYRILLQLIYQAIHRGKAQVLNVMNERNELSAGAFFIESNTKAIFLFSGLSEEGKKLGAMPFLIDSFIRKKVEKNITLDFEGSNDMNLARFYKSFGSRECFYPFIKINRLSFPLNLLK